MRNLILKKLKRNGNFVTIASEQTVIAENFCLNLVVQLVELDTRMFVENNKNILIFHPEVSSINIKIDALQNKYYPNFQIKEKIFIASEDDYCPHDLNDVELLKKFIKKNQIGIIYLAQWSEFWDNSYFWDFTNEVEMIVIHLNEHDWELNKLRDDVIKIDIYSETELVFSYLNDRKEIVSKIIPDEAIVQL